MEDLFIPKIKNKPWSKYLDFKDNASLKTSIDNIVDKIFKIMNIRVEMACCIALIYLTGSRAKEILPWRYRSKYKKDAIEMGYNIDKPGFILQHLTYYKDFNGEMWFNFKTFNLKQNSKKSSEKIEIRERLKKVQKNNYKEIRLPAFGDLPDIKLLQMIDKYFKDVLGVYRDDLDDAIDRAKPGDYIQPFKEEMLNYHPFQKVTRNTTYHYVKKYLNMSIHNLRELRMQHLLRYYRFEIQDLQLAGGWSINSNMPLRYSRSKIEHLQDKFLRLLDREPILNSI